MYARVRTALALAGAAFACVAPAAAQERLLVDQGTPARYLANLSDPGVGLAWTAPGFDDGGWNEGTYGIGYEVGVGAQDLISTPVPIGTRSVYTRTTFEVADPSKLKDLWLGLDRDDGVVVWINGTEAYRSPEMPAGPPAWNTLSLPTESSNAAMPRFDALVNLTAALDLLVPGTNSVAIGVWNDLASSSDLVLVPRLVADRALRLVRGPYLQEMSPDGVEIRWRTKTPESSRVAYGTSPTNLQEVVDPSPRGDHAVRLTGLQPDTRYYYGVGSADSLIVGDERFTFRTPPLAGVPRPLRIWILGDAGTNNHWIRRVRDRYYREYADRPTDLWLLLGDNAYNDGTDAQYQTAFFEIFPRMLRQAPVWPTFGNHEAFSSDSATGTGPYFDIFNLPTAGESGGVPSGTEAYYSFDHANVHFVVLDSMGSDRSPGGAMATWLEADLDATTQDWIIAYWHHPAYSKGLHDSDVALEQRQMREVFVPILESHGVDLVFAGHSHDYERTMLIDGHEGSSATFGPQHVIDPGDGDREGDGAYVKPTLGPGPREGAIYTVAGSSGQVSGGTLDHPAMRVSYNLHGAVVLDIDGAILDARFVAPGGEILDRYRVVKGGAPPAPEAAFDATPVIGSVPLQVQFTDMTSGNPIEWEWDFEADGEADSAAPSPSHTYDVPGLYTVAQRVGNVVGVDDTVRDRLVCAVGTPPQRVDGLRQFRDTVLWTSPGGPLTFALVRGSLDALRATDGDFVAAAPECAAAGVETYFVVDPLRPDPGSAFYYLVGAEDCAGNVSSLESGSPTQIAPRGLDPAAICP